MVTNSYNPNTKNNRNSFTLKVESERILVLAGGGDTKTPWGKTFYDTFATHAGGKYARIGIFTASAGVKEDPNLPKTNENYHIEQLLEQGSNQAEGIPIDLNCIKNNSDPDLVTKIRSMTGFLFGGGDQSRYITCLRTEDDKDSPVLAAIRQVYESGTVIAGTSAGTVVQCGSPMITGDRSYNANGGFGFFSYGILDTHFNQRDRESRLISLAKATKTRKSYGIDENTILVVRNADTPEVSMNVLGEGGVHIYTFLDEKFKEEHLKVGDVYCPSEA